MYKFTINFEFDHRNQPYMANVMTGKIGGNKGDLIEAEAEYEENEPLSVTAVLQTSLEDPDPEDITEEIVINCVQSFYGYTPEVKITYVKRIYDDRDEEQEAFEQETKPYTFTTNEELNEAFAEAFADTIKEGRRVNDEGMIGLCFDYWTDGLRKDREISEQLFNSCELTV